MKKNRRHLNSIRSSYAELAMDLSQKGRKEEARNALEKADKMMLQENIPYGHISRGNMHNRNSINFLQACYMADDKTLAAKVLKSVKTDLQQQVKFYNALSESKQEFMAYEKKTTDDYLNALNSMEQMYSNKPLMPEAGSKLMVPTAPASKPDATKKDSGKK